MTTQLKARSRRRLVRPRALTSLLLALAAAASGCATTPPTATPSPVRTASPDLAAVVDSITRTAPLHRTHWGILARDAATGQLVFALNEERNFVPASNMKLVTGAVALAELGEGYRYRTRLETTGWVAGDTLAGALVVRGSGDPTLSARFHDTPFAALDSLADSVAVRGIRRLADGLVVDATRFTDAPVHFAWFLGNLPSRFAAGTAAFGIEEGTLLVVVHPGPTVGAPAEIEVLPFAGVAALETRLVTGESGSRRQVSTERRIPGDTLVLEGVVPLGSAPDTLVLAAPDPAELAARSLAGALAARGVRVDGPVRVVRDSAALARQLGPEPGSPVTDSPGSLGSPVTNSPGSPGSPVTGSTSPLVTWTSPPMTEIVAAFMLPSQNWIAEQLVKTVGAEREGDGSWAGGLSMHARYLVEQVGLDSTAFFLRDGSGLSNQSLITPAGIVALLDHARTQPWFEAFRTSLPRPGQEGGTLSGRLEGLEDRVAAKTGTITHVNGLSGYLVTASGRELTFSILTNATGASAAAVRAAMDRIVRALVEE